MHDLHAADYILKTVLETAAQKKLRRVTRIVVSLGTVVEHGAEILPGNLKFNLVALARGSGAEDASVEIRKVPGHQLVINEIEGDA
jgi:Zn finger protein HypA/HybF involved in hydrogenase expression